MRVPSDYADRLLRVRRTLRLTQGQFAEAIGAANKAVVYQWESKKRKPSPVLSLDAICVSDDVLTRTQNDAGLKIRLRLLHQDAALRQALRLYGLAFSLPRRPCTNNLKTPAPIRSGRSPLTARALSPMIDSAVWPVRRKRLAGRNQRARNQVRFAARPHEGRKCPRRASVRVQNRLSGLRGDLR
jgi:DNA-binding XRE family transcriptional regulator